MDTFLRKYCANIILDPSTSFQPKGSAWVSLSSGRVGGIKQPLESFEFRRHHILYLLDFVNCRMNVCGNEWPEGLCSWSCQQFRSFRWRSLFGHPRGRWNTYSWRSACSSHCAHRRAQDCDARLVCHCGACITLFRRTHQFSPWGSLHR